MKQLVSILIPAFNAANWIGSCIESALAQTWTLKEIIVVDDGSTDSTFKVAQTYASSNVLIKTQDNCGASAARNHALSLAQGDYIQWLDADDLLSPDKIARQIEDAEPGIRSHILLSGAWGKFFDRPENTRFVPDMLWENMKTAEWLFRKLDSNLWMAIESWLVSRKLTELAGPWNENLSFDDDGEYFTRVLLNAQNIHFIPESCSLCRRGNTGLSHYPFLNNQKLDSLAFSIFAQIHVLLTLEESQRTKGAAIKYLNRHVTAFYPDKLDILQQMHSMAAQLGGHLDPPRLRPKYQFIKYIFRMENCKKSTI